MGTEIFPKILLLAQIVAGTIGVVSLLTVIAAYIEYKIHPHKKEKQEEAKGHMVNSLIAFTIILIVYFILSAIGPAFRILFAA